MKRGILIAAVLACAFAADATTFTQVWRIPGLDAAQGWNGPDWFPIATASAPRTVRGAAYNPATDHVVFVSRTAGSLGANGIHVVRASDGVEISATSMSYATGGGAFAINMPAATSDGVVYVGSLQTNWAAAAPTGNFKIYRLENETTTGATMAFDANDLSVPTNTRLGDTLAVVGTGTATEIWAGTGLAVTSAGPHLVKFTTVDGMTFTVAAKLTSAVDANWTMAMNSPTRLGLSVLGSGSSAAIWADSSGPNHYPRKFNATTAAVEDQITTAVDVYLGASCTMGLALVGTDMLLASGPGAYESVGSVYSPGATPWGASLGKVFNVNTLGSAVPVAVTEPLGLQNTTGTWYPNTDGTGNIFYDSVRQNFGFLVTNNGCTVVHVSATTGVGDWNLY